jgi:hypothetical protein
MACEKCWGDAYLRHRMDPRKSQAEHYRDLIHEREENWCTPEEQNGETISKADDGSTTEED